MENFTAVRTFINKPIVLVGMAGSGKSTIGKKLARRLSLQFYDSDRVIEARQNLSVSEIYDFKGAEYFKAQEALVIKEILNYGPIVLSIGGNSFMNKEVRDLIKKHSISIWLFADLEVLYNRVSRRNTRPELNSGNKMEILRTMITERYPLYKQADIAVESTNDDIYHITDNILVQLRKYIISKQNTIS